MNASMPRLRSAFAAAAFTDVTTVLGSGNVLFSAPPAPAATLERRAEQAMAEQLGRSFPTIVRSVTSLRALLAADPFAGEPQRPGAKRAVTFLRRRPTKVPRLPVELEGARILALRGREVFTIYVPSPRGAVFMTLIEETFGKDVTTRTWDTVAKVAR